MDLSGLLNTIVPDNIFANFERRVTALSIAPVKIEKPAKVVAPVKAIKPVKAIVKKEKQISQRKQEIITAEKIVFRKKMEERKAKNLIEKKMVESRNFNRRKYKTKSVDYSQLTTIRINAKTIIYSKPGEEEITKANFLKNYSKSLSQKDQNSNQ